jgi:hypothetical protein
LLSVTIPDSVTSIRYLTFAGCTSLTSATIGVGVTNLENTAFSLCTSLRGVYFKGDAPSLGGTNVFYNDSKATVYYLPGTTGWGATFGGRPTALWPTALWPPPTIQTSPQTQTAEAGSAVSLRVKASSPLPLFYPWYLNNTNLISCSTNSRLELTGVQFTQAGAYIVVVSNVLGAITSAPAMLNVIAAVERRPVPGVQVTGQAGSLLNVDYANSLSPAPTWTPLGSVSLAGTSGLLRSYSAAPAAAFLPGVADDPARPAAGHVLSGVCWSTAAGRSAPKHLWRLLRYLSSLICIVQTPSPFDLPPACWVYSARWNGPKRTSLRRC